MGAALVTGATGFLGRHLAARLLDGGRDVILLHRRNSAASPVLAELRARGARVALFEDFSEIGGLVDRAVPVQAFHLATRYQRDHASADIGGVVDANITYGMHVLESLLGRDCAVVSTMSYFQFRHGEPESLSLYSATKQAFLDISRYYRDIRSLDVRDVVIYDTYGPSDTRDKIIPRLLDVAAGGGQITMGTSAQPLNLLYVGDVVEGLIAASVPGVAGTLCLSAPQLATLGDVVGVIEEVSGVTLDKSFNDLQPVNSLVHESGDWPLPPGWVPRTTLQVGLEQCWAWKCRSLQVP